MGKYSVDIFLDNTAVFKKDGRLVDDFDDAIL